MATAVQRTSPTLGGTRTLVTKPRGIEQSSKKLAHWGPSNERRKVVTENVPDLKYSLPLGAKDDDDDSDVESVSEHVAAAKAAGEANSAAVLARADGIMEHLDAVHARHEKQSEDAEAKRNKSKNRLSVGQPASQVPWRRRSDVKTALATAVSGASAARASSDGDEEDAEQAQARAMADVSNVLALYVARPDVLGTDIKVAAKLAEAIAGPPSNKSMMDLKTVSHYAELYNDLSKSVSTLASHTAQMETLNLDGVEQKGVSSKFAYAELSGLVKTIRKHLTGLNWAALNTDLKKLARRADVGEAQVNSFLASMKPAREDSHEAILTARYHGEKLLASRQLAMTSQLSKFHGAVAKHGETLRPVDDDKVPEDSKRARNRIAQLLQNKMEDQERILELADLHQKKQSDSQSDNASNKDRRGSRFSVVSGQTLAGGKQQVDRPRPAPLSRYESPANARFYAGHQALPVSLGSGPLSPLDSPSTPPAHDADEEQRFDNPRYLHLKPIYVKHKDRILDLEKLLNTADEQVEKLREAISHTIEARRGTSAPPTSPGESPKKFGGGAFGKDLRKRAMLRREREALLSYLNSFTCEDDPLPAAAAELAERAAAKASEQVLKEKAETLREQIAFLKEQQREAQKDVDDMMLAVSAKAESKSIDDPWMFDEQLNTTWFLINPKKPLFQFLEQRSRQMLDGMQAGQRGRRELHSAVHNATQASQMEESVRELLWTARSTDTAKLAPARATADKEYDSLYQSLSKAIGLAGRSLPRSRSGTKEQHMTATNSRQPSKQLKDPFAELARGPSELARGPSELGRAPSNMTTMSATDPSASKEAPPNAHPGSPSALGAEAPSQVWVQRKQQGQRILEQVAKLERLRQQVQELESVVGVLPPEDGSGAPSAAILDAASPQQQSQDPLADIATKIAQSSGKGKAAKPRRRTMTSSDSPKKDDAGSTARKQSTKANTVSSMQPLNEEDPSEDEEQSRRKRGGSEADADVSSAMEMLLSPRGADGKGKGPKGRRKGGKSGLSLQEILKQCESSNRVLRKRRDAKFAALRHLHAKKGIAMDAGDMKKHEILSDKQERLDKEMASVKAEIRNLTRMVTFWDQRIARAEGEGGEGSPENPESASADGEDEGSGLMFAKGARGDLLAELVDASCRRLSISTNMDPLQDQDSFRSEDSDKFQGGAVGRAMSRSRRQSTADAGDSPRMMQFARPNRNRGKLQGSSATAALNPDKAAESVTTMALQQATGGSRRLSAAAEDVENLALFQEKQEMGAMGPRRSSGVAHRGVIKSGSMARALSLAGRPHSATSDSSHEDSAVPRKSVPGLLSMARGIGSPQNGSIARALRDANADEVEALLKKQQQAQSGMSVTSTLLPDKFMERLNQPMPSNRRSYIAADGSVQGVAPWDEMLTVSGLGGSGDGGQLLRSYGVAADEEDVRRSSVLELFGQRTGRSQNQKESRLSRGLAMRQAQGARPQEQFAKVLGALVTSHVADSVGQPLGKGSSRLRETGGAAGFTGDQFAAGGPRSDSVVGDLGLHSAKMAQGSGAHAGPEVRRRGRESFLGGISGEAHRAFMQKLKTQGDFDEVGSAPISFRMQPGGMLSTNALGVSRSPAGVMNKVLEAMESMDWKPMSNHDRLHFYTSTGLLQFDELNAAPDEWPPLYRAPLRADGHSVSLPPKGAWDTVDDPDQQRIRLLARWRHLLLLKYGHPYRVFRGLCPKGSVSVALTRISFVQAHLRLGFSLEESEDIFDFAAVVHGPTSTQVTRALTRQRLSLALRMAKPVATVVQLRSRLLHRYGRLQVALRRADLDKDGCLNETEFCSLCASVGCPSPIAQWIFLQTWEANPEELPGLPRLTPFAFVMTLEEAEGLAVMQHLRKQVQSHWETIYDAIPRLSPGSFAGPLSFEEFETAVSHLGLTVGDAQQLFELAGEREAEFVYMEHAILRCMGGLGRFHAELVEELKHQHRDAGAPLAPPKMPQEPLREAADAASRARTPGSRREQRRMGQAPNLLGSDLEIDSRRISPGGAGGRAAALVHRSKLLAKKRLHEQQWAQRVLGPILIIQSRQPPSHGPSIAHHKSAVSAVVRANGTEALRRLARNEVFRSFQSAAKAFEAEGCSLQRKLNHNEFRTAVAGLHLPARLCNDLFTHLGAVTETGRVTLAELIHAVKVELASQEQQKQEEQRRRDSEQIFSAQNSPRRGSLTQLPLRPEQRQALQQVNSTLEIILRSNAPRVQAMIPRQALVLALRQVGLPAPLQQVLLAKVFGKSESERVTIKLDECLKLLKDMAGSIVAMEEGSPGRQARNSVSFGRRRSCPELQKHERELLRVDAKAASDQEKPASSRERRRASDPGLGQPSAKPRAEIAKPQLKVQHSADSPTASSDSSSSSESLAEGSRPPRKLLRRRSRRASSHRSEHTTRSTGEEAQRGGIKPSFRSGHEDSDHYHGFKGGNVARLRSRKEGQEVAGATRARLNLRLTIEQLQEHIEREARLADLRVLVFAEAEAYERAVRHMRDFRQKLLRRSGNLQAALGLLRSEGHIASNAILPAGFHAIATRLHFSSMDAERIFKAIELVEGKKPVTAIGFVVAMHFVAPVASVFDLRTRLVQRYRALDVGLLALYQAMHGSDPQSASHGFTPSMFQDAMLRLLGIEQRVADALFHHLDARCVSQVRFRDLEVALEEPSALLQLEGLRAHLLRLAETIEAGLGQTGVFTDREAGLNAVVTAGHLVQMGLPSEFAACVLAWLQLSEPEGKCTVRTLLRQLHAFDSHILRGTGLAHHVKDELTDHFAGRPRNTQDFEHHGTPFAERDDRALEIWRRVRTSMQKHFGTSGTAQEIFDILDVGGAGALGLSAWVSGWASAGLPDRDTAEALFGLLVGWRHSNWIHLVEGDDDPTVNTADLARGLRLAAPINTLRSLRSRLQEEFGSLSKAYEKLCDASHTVCYHSWIVGLHRAWVTHAEAAPWFVLFEKDADGRVSHSAFTKMLTSPDATIAVRNLCAQLVHQCGCVAAAFEKLDLAAPLTSTEFRMVCATLWGVSPVEGQEVFSYISHQEDASILLADLLEVLAAMEEQHHWWLLPLIRRDEPGQQRGKNSQSIAAWAWKKLSPPSESAAATEGSKPVLPQLDHNKWKQKSGQDQDAHPNPKPLQPQSARRAAPANTELGADLASPNSVALRSARTSPSPSPRPQKGAVVLPKLNAQQRAGEKSEARRFVEGVLKDKVNGMGPSASSSGGNKSEDEDRSSNARQWTRHAVQRFLHSSPSEQVDRQLLARVAQSLGVDVVAAAARAGAKKRVGPSAGSMAARPTAVQTLPAVPARTSSDSAEASKNTPRVLV